MIKESTYQETYPRLFSLAYRMTGSVSDAEDAIQEAWTRLLNQPPGKVDVPAHWLYRTVANLAIDQLRVSKRTATGYPGPWLPEPIAIDTYFRGPEASAIIHEDVSMALLLMLEHLTPIQRAVWVLRTSLELPFAEIGEILDESTENCRQLYRRANQRIERSEEFELEPAPKEITSQFLSAVQSGDASAVANLLMDDATWIGDGGGVKPATARPVEGIDHVSRGLAGLFAKAAPYYRVEPAMVNGASGFIIVTDEGIELAYSLLVKDAKISRVLAVRNPHKLAGVQPRREFSLHWHAHER